MKKPKQPIILPPRDAYADKHMLVETLVLVARNYPTAPQAVLTRDSAQGLAGACVI